MTQKETWKLSPTIPDYMVSNYGRIMRVPFFAQMPNGGIRQYGGEPWFGVDTGEGRMCFRHKGKNYKVHRLVCEAFNGPQPFDEAVCMHVDEDYRNNNADNLKWGTQKENLNAAGFKEYCRFRTGEKSPRAKWKKRMAA